MKKWCGFLELFGLRKESKSEKVKRTALDKRLEEEFVRIDTMIRNEELFLDSQFTINELAHNYGLNRTYVSKAINNRNTTFKNYINSLRIEYLKKYLRRYSYEEMRRLDQDTIAELSGFSSRRTMNNILRRHLKFNFKELTMLGFWDD